MNIITADFNWISLLIILGASIFGMIKSNSKKTAQKPFYPEPDYTNEEYEDADERYIVYESAKDKELEQVLENRFQPETAIHEITDDYYNPVLEEAKKESPVYASGTEEENEEESVYFDIRQAVISSEVLRRPEF